MSDYKLVIDSGIESDQIVSFFRQHAEENPKHVFTGQGFLVRLSFLKERDHGSIRLPRTLIQFEGDQEACQAIIIKYRKRFMRGGG